MKRPQRRPGKGASFASPSRPEKIGWKAIVRAALILALLAGIIGSIALYAIASRGLSAHVEPSRLEEMLARAMRRWATPASVRNQSNPVEATPEVFNQALEHYADHCATCHANDGSGDTEIGRSLYPRAPDMRSTQTQSLTDGELFSIIEHGIRLTGMPAWGNGTSEGARESWGLVHFIRRLPKLTSEDIERMEALNPRTPAELKEAEEIRRFLQGEPAPPAPAMKGHKD